MKYIDPGGVYICPACRGYGCISCEETGRVGQDKYNRLRFTEGLADMVDALSQSWRMNMKDSEDDETAA